MTCECNHCNNERRRAWYMNIYYFPEIAYTQLRSRDKIDNKTGLLKENTK